MIFALYLKYSPENSDRTKGQDLDVLFKYLDTQIVVDRRLLWEVLESHP